MLGLSRVRQVPDDLLGKAIDVDNLFTYIQKMGGGKRLYEGRKSVSQWKSKGTASTGNEY